MAFIIVFGLQCKMTQSWRRWFGHGNFISIGMARKCWCWLESLLQKSSGKIVFVNCYNKLVNTKKCPSIGKYTPTGIRGMVAPRLVPRCYQLSQAHKANIDFKIGNYLVPEKIGFEWKDSDYHDWLRFSTWCFARNDKTRNSGEGLESRFFCKKLP